MGTHHTREIETDVDHRKYENDKVELVPVALEVMHAEPADL